MEKLIFRTKINYFYNKSKRYTLNLRLNFATYYKFSNLKKQNIDNYLSLQNYFDKNKIKIIEGNHTYEYALNDVLNCKKFAKPSSILVLDDVVIHESYRTNSNKEPTKVWKELNSKNYISEIDYAHFMDINRGVAVGKYNFYE